MYVEVQPIPNDSYGLRFWNREEDYLNDIELMVVLMNLGDGVAEVGLTKGDMTSEFNIALGLKAYELGFTRLRFTAVKDHKVTRWATKIRDDEDFSYYEVDLVAAVKYFEEHVSL
jgi:hypothetical protein